MDLSIGSTEYCSTNSSTSISESNQNIGKSWDDSGLNKVLGKSETLDFKPQTIALNESIDPLIFNASKARAPVVSRIVNFKRSILSSYEVGISQIIQQKEALTAKNGLSFTIMVAGQSDLGKSTFINSLFGFEVMPPSGYESAALESESQHFKPIRKETIDIEGIDMKLNLTVIDTPMYGNNLNNAFAWTPLTNYIDDQIRSYIFQEEQPDRAEIVDRRVHCCLYFLEPTNRGLSTLDVVTMKELSKRVNLIPIIAKADTLTVDHKEQFKSQIKKILEVQSIKICNFIDSNDEYNKELLDLIPFAIISSTETVENEDGELVLGRKYDWGTIETENPAHSDFSILKELLFNKYMATFIQSTNGYYENCRSSLLNTRVLKARDLCYSSESSNSIINEDLKQLYKSLDYEHCDINHLKNYACYQLFNKKYIDDLVLEWSQEYIHRQWETKKRFNEIIAIEETKFKEWRKAILRKQDRFNTEISSMHKQIEQLQLECHDLGKVLTASKFSKYEKSASNSVRNLHHDQD